MAPERRENAEVRKLREAREKQAAERVKLQDVVYMTYPGVEKVATATRRAFQRVWEPKGWQEVDQQEVAEGTRELSTVQTTSPPTSRLQETVSAAQAQARIAQLKDLDRQAAGAKGAE